MDNINDFENDMRTHGELDEIFKKLLRANEEEVIQIFIRFLSRSLNGLSFDVNGQNYSLASESNISGDIEGRELDIESRTDLQFKRLFLKRQIKLNKNTKLKYKELRMNCN